MREVTGTDPPKSRDGANNHERAESKAAANLATDYPSHEFAATENYLGPGTALIPLTQGRFAFVDSNAPFSDPCLADYLRFLARELSDDGVRAFLHARFAYDKFQRSGTPESRRFAWHMVQLACRLSAKSRHVSTKGASSKTPITDPSASNRAERRQS
jgi:hypothetical protein